jgi:hypothetical protein
VIAPRLALLTVAGALAAAGVTGCAQQSGVKDKAFSGPAAQVANTIRALDDAYDDEKQDDPGAEKVCRSLLSARLVAAFGGAKECPKTARAALQNSDDTEMDVRDVKIEGDVATAQVRLKVNDDEQRVDTLRLVQEGPNGGKGQSWKFDGNVVGKKGSKVGPEVGTPAVTTGAATPTPAGGTTAAPASK